MVALNDQAKLLGPRFDVITERVKLAEKAAEAFAEELAENARAGIATTQEESQAFGGILATLDAAKAAEKERDEAQKATRESPSGRGAKSQAASGRSATPAGRNPGDERTSCS